jgi:hypothetical protein
VRNYLISKGFDFDRVKVGLEMRRNQMMPTGMSFEHFRGFVGDDNSQ